MSEQKVYVIDDDEPVCDAISLLLESVGLDSEVFTSAQEFLAAYDQEMSGCIVSDVRMARVSGLMMQGQLKGLGCQLPIIFITGHGDVQMAVQALKDGAFDFIQKPFRKDNLLGCVNLALNKNLEDDDRDKKNKELIERVKRLTKRESEVLAMLLKGSSSKQIAKELGVSHRTVDVHRQNILNKLELKSVAILIGVLSSVEGLF